ncbi:6,7-dimethyl-8-ribityllumazine synthase [Hyphomicrobium sp. CS1GBMeth3]|uniref:6,7-dimethyl-8-ribityllumazine synthase n=1 Tax=Hyphomicrobium sp. CS1GBMeth3 TaxID=1892845 RepID=UPI0009FA8E84|nr:6,7-dimethyl-8-ribityllumazine synthase [Hyphomicrobium sp. CS1GBMeth3]
MVRDEHHKRPAMELHSGSTVRVLIIEAPYYQQVTDELIAGALAVLDQAGVGYDRVPVPGALEIPQALAQAVTAGLFAGSGRDVYAGAIVLGCVIRGETSHYDIVCNNTNHWLMETAIRHNIPVGNGVLTVDTEVQALARAKGGADGKGGDAARACLRLIKLARDFGRRAS